MAAGIIWRVGATVAFSTLTSVAASYWLMRLAFGTDSHTMIGVADVDRFVMIVSTILPVLISGPACYFRIRLVDELKEARRTLQKLAHTDQLTNLLNRRGFDEAASATLAAARKSGSPVAMLMCDIDHFKSMNDRFGHGFGDKALVHVAEALVATAGNGNFIAGRQGGDEFVMALPGVSRSEAARIAERLRVLCEQRPVDGEAANGGVPVSVGIAIDRRAKTSFPELMGRADAALYEVKRSGRNRVVIVDLPDETVHVALTSAA